VLQGEIIKGKEKQGILPNKDESLGLLEKYGINKNRVSPTFSHQFDE